MHTAKKKKKKEQTTHTQNLPFQQSAVVWTQRSTCMDRSGRERNWIPTQQCIPICKWSLYGYRQKVLKPLRLSYHFLSGVSWGRRNTKPDTDECIQWTGIILNQIHLIFFFLSIAMLLQFFIHYSYSSHNRYLDLFSYTLMGWDEIGIMAHISLLFSITAKTSA